MLQVIPLHETDTMLARHGSFHLNRTLDHSVDDCLGGFLFEVVEQDDCCRGTN